MLFAAVRDACRSNLHTSDLTDLFFLRSVVGPGVRPLLDGPSGGGVFHSGRPDWLSHPGLCSRLVTQTHAMRRNTTRV